MHRSISQLCAVSRETLQIDNDNSLPRDIHDRRHPTHTARMYDIKSLDVGTFESSQNFLARYRLWALIDNIIATDPHNTPLEHRTIHWLVDSYVARFRERDLYQRLIFDPSGDDVDGEGTTIKRRHLRHVPRAEIFGIFATHADWILAQHLASTSNTVQKLDIASWVSFCRQVKYARKAAAREKVQWGVPYRLKNATTSWNENDLDLSQFGENREFWDRKIKAATKKKIHKPV